MDSFQEWIQSEEYQQLCKDMNEAYEKTIKDLKENLTQEMLADVRQWRVGEGPEDKNTHSWRGVARLFAEKYPDFSQNYGIEAGNQICGMQICEATMHVLNQKPEDGWN